jgi:dipeptide/tripeptide permease
MTRNLMGANGTLDVMAEEPAKAWFHWFTSAVYFMPLIGAVISDVWLGKFKTIIWFSMVYCVGFVILALDHTRLGLFGGLALIAMASGIIKPCLSANVGDQFGSSNKHLLTKFYGWFYFSVNLGAAVSMYKCPDLLDKYGPTVGFGVPGAFMFVAMLSYWLGRYKLVHIPPAGKTGWRETLDKEGVRALRRLCIIFLFVSMFFALFYQSESAWVLQAGKMNLKWLGKDWLPAQMQAANPVLIMILIPLFSWVIYPAFNRLCTLTPLRKIGIGMFIAVLSFVVPALVESDINGGDIFKCSSRSRIAGLEAIRLIDGITDGSGWSSDGVPSPDAPEEIVIRLRERKAWNINAIKIEPMTTISHREIAAMIDDLAFATLREVKELKDSGATTSDIKSVGQKADRLKVAARAAKEAAKRAMKDAPERDRRNAAARAAKAAVEPILTELGEAMTFLDDKAYYPKDISVFAGDFTDKLIPKPFSELSNEKKIQISDPGQYTQKAGWVRSADLTCVQDGKPVEVNVEPVTATHILVQIRSNFSGARVKIGEIQVMTSQSIPAESKVTAGDIWPNVAGIGYKPSIGWQFFAYIILTAAEIMVSITALEFAYTQAPRKMKSLIQSVELLAISLGNAFAAVVNSVITNEDGTSKLPGASYYWFFLIAMLVTGIIFIPVARWYKPKEYIQDETAEESSA